MPEITKGTVAPDFELPDQNGRIVRLSQFRGKRPVVVYFYPKDDTSGCTAEACKFRDDSPGFEAAEAKIIGISDDSSESHNAIRMARFFLFSNLASKCRYGGIE